MKNIATAGMKNVTGMRVLSIPLKQIDAMKHQPKEREKGVDVLAKDIGEKGLIYPIRVAPYATNGNGDFVLGQTALQNKRCRYLLCDGHRRLWAHKMLKLKEIPAILTTDMDYLETLLMWARANSKRLAPNPYSMATYIRTVSEELKVRFVSTGKGRRDAEREALRMLADATGYSSTFMHSRLAIFSAPKDIQKMIQKESSRASLPSEVNHGIPIRFRADVYQGYIDGDLVSTLDPRPLGKELKAIEKDVALPNAVKLRRGKAVIKTFRATASKQIPSDILFESYHNDVDGLRRTILNWNFRGLSIKQLDVLTTALADLQLTFRELRRQNGLLPAGKP